MFKGVTESIIKEFCNISTETLQITLYQLNYYCCCRCCYVTTTCDRAFLVSDSQLWNTLPQNITSALSLTVF